MLKKLEFCKFWICIKLPMILMLLIIISKAWLDALWLHLWWNLYYFIDLIVYLMNFHRKWCFWLLFSFVINDYLLCIDHIALFSIYFNYLIYDLVHTINYLCVDLWLCRGGKFLVFLYDVGTTKCNLNS